MAYGEDGGDVRDDDERRLGAGERARRGGLWLVGRPWIVIGVGLFVVFAFWAKGTRTQPHEVKVVFDEAVSVYSGLDVRVDGLDAGKVKNIKNDNGRAVVTLGIKDDKIWPLHQGTTAALRFGSTIGNGTRQIELMPGPDSAPKIPDHGVIPNADSIESTEFDDIFDTFNKSTQKHLRGTLKGTGDTFGDRAPELRSGVQGSAGGLQSLANLTGDLSANEPALRAFVANTYRVTSALQTRKARISDLVGVASQTFRTFAANTDGIKGSLERFPGTVREARTTLSRLDTSVDHLDGLVTDLRPGAVELGRLSHDLRPALADLKKTVPVAVSTFRTGEKTAPSITALLREAQPFSKTAAPAFTGLTPLMTCLRPYAPDVAGLLTKWTSFNQGYDNTGHIGRIWGNAGAAGVTSTPMTPAQYTSLTGQGYALIRPPGFDAGKPWFQPECGITAAGLDPKQDPEVSK
jgi:virulence factor Mce-like protein